MTQIVICVPELFIIILLLLKDGVWNLLDYKILDHTKKIRMSLVRFVKLFVPTSSTRGGGWVFDSHRLWRWDTVSEGVLPSRRGRMSRVLDCTTRLFIDEPTTDTGVERLPSFIIQQSLLHRSHVHDVVPRPSRSTGSDSTISPSLPGRSTTHWSEIGEGGSVQKYLVFTTSFLSSPDKTCLFVPLLNYPSLLPRSFPKS